MSHSYSIRRGVKAGPKKRRLTYDYELFGDPTDLGEMVDENESPAKPKPNKNRPSTSVKNSVHQDWMKSGDGFAEFKKKPSKRNVYEFEDSEATTQEIDSFSSEDDDNYDILPLEKTTAAKENLLKKKITNRHNSNSDIESKVKEISSVFDNKAKNSNSETSNSKSVSNAVPDFTELLAASTQAKTFVKRTKSNSGYKSVQKVKKAEPKFVIKADVLNESKAKLNQSLINAINSITPEKEKDHRKKDKPTTHRSIVPNLPPSQDPTISDFDSDSEVGQECVVQETLFKEYKVSKQDGDSPVSISTVSSTTSVEELSANKRRASDWVRNIQLKSVTPVKDADDVEEMLAGDSAKKKKTKYIRFCM